MPKLLHLPSLWLALACAPALAGTAYQSLHLDDQPGRVLNGVIWYPSSSKGPTQTVGQSPVNRGVEALPNGSLTAGRHPLVVLSHGLGGNWANQSWLAEPLVAQGAVVAAVNHPGTSIRDMKSAQTPKLWARPQDVQRVLDYLLHSPPWRDAIDSQRIAVIGHSMGGYTAMAVAGARFDLARFTQACQRQPAMADCAWARRVELGKQDLPLLQASWRDARVSAVVSLDLGFAPGLTPDSLAALTTPALVLAAGDEDPSLPAASQSLPMAAHMPVRLTRYQQIADASHFSFLPECPPGALALLQEEGPDEAIICQDHQGRSRAALHQSFSTQIVDFLRQNGVLRSIKQP